LRELGDQDVAMSQKDPNPTYLLKTEDGYIVAVEGHADVHITNAETIKKIEALIKKRVDAGVSLSKLLKAKFSLTAMSNVGATHTTGAGDYDEQTEKKKRRKK
jgi:hypothetical protein